MPLATALHSQDSTQRLPVHGDGDEIISRRDRRCATATTEPAPPGAANRCPTECLRHESQRAAATAATTGRLTRTPQQGAERREERGVGRPFAGLAAAFATGSGKRANRRRRARSRLTGTFDESSCDKRRSRATTAPPAAASTTGTESEAL